MRIALGSPYPYDELRLRGGIEAVALYLSQALARRDGVELHIVSCNHSVRKSFTERRGAVTFHWLATGQRLYGLRAATIDAWRVRWVYDRIQPDIVHSQGCDEYALAVPKHIPLVVTIHGLALFAPTLQKTAHLRGAIGRYRRWIGDLIIKRSVQKARAIISTAGDYVSQVMGGMLDGKKLYSIDNPIPKDFWLTPLDDCELGRNVLCVGSIIEFKNTIGLVQAFAHVAERLSHTKLQLVGNIGEPAYFERVQAEVTELGLQQRVEFLGKGQLDQTQLLDVYARASVVALASLQETAPVAIAQAMAAGKAIVATRVGGIPWMVEDGVTGYLVDIGDTQGMADRIVELLQDKSKRQGMGQVAQKVASQRFAADMVAEKTVRVYRDLLGGEN